MYPVPGQVQISSVQDQFNMEPQPVKAAGPCWSDPRAEMRSAAPHFHHATHCVPSQAASDGDPLCNMSDRGIILSGYLKDYWRGKFVCKGFFSNNSWVSVVPCHAGLFLHSRCDAQGAP